MSSGETIPFFDLNKTHFQIADALENAIHNVIRRGNFILGDECLAFEKEYSKYLGCKNVITVNSGSDALFLILKALGIGPGDEVITASHTFISTVDAIIRNGATPVLADINPETYCIDANTVKPLITCKTKALMPVHLYGQSCDMDAMIGLAQRNGLKIVEDACQAHGALYRGRHVGCLGIAGCFSFYPTKNLGCLGDGGCIATNDTELAEKLRLLRNYGQKVKYKHDMQGINSRLDEIQAAVLRVKLQYLDVWNNQRKNIARFYTRSLEGSKIKTPMEAQYADHVYHLYVIQCEDRNKLQQQLEHRGIRTLIHYPIPVHRHPYYAKLVRYLNLDNTDMVCKRILSLPLFPGMTQDMADMVVSKVRLCQQ
jgi:dTDP-4-amino-4,6-dideoxygalactose transaminase